MIGIKSKEILSLRNFDEIQAMDGLAVMRNVETLYLHVDVENTAACSLYQSTGYEVLDPNDPIYAQFTTTLNLHDGATMGRSHYLMQKKITKTQTWYPLSKRSQVRRQNLSWDEPNLI